MKFLTGSSIKSMMRTHRVTIRVLALRMNISFQRVHDVRENGVTGKCFCLDWTEAITQTGVFAPTVTLADGYNGHTKQFFASPLEVDGDLVKLRCAEPGAGTMIRWARDADLSAAA